jgi:hypothetical protein
MGQRSLPGFARRAAAVITCCSVGSIANPAAAGVWQLLIAAWASR